MIRRLLAFFAFLLIRALGLLLRYRYLDRHHSLLVQEKGHPVLYAFFHGRQLMLLNYPLPQPMVQMVSLSKDGELQAMILRYLGFVVVRGSPGKGGRQALLEMTDLVLNGCHGALAVDGSRGPLMKVKPGILHLARDSSAAIVPLAAGATANTVLERAWDRYMIPWPFSRVVVVEGEPMQIDEDIDDEELELKRIELEKRLIDLQGRADALAAGRADTKGNGN